jgi:hypothetical protein
MEGEILCLQNPPIWSLAISLRIHKGDEMCGDRVTPQRGMLPDLHGRHYSLGEFQERVAKIMGDISQSPIFTRSESQLGQKRPHSISKKGVVGDGNRHVRGKGAISHLQEEALRHSTRVHSYSEESKGKNSTSTPFSASNQPLCIGNQDSGPSTPIAEKSPPITREEEKLGGQSYFLFSSNCGLGMVEGCDSRVKWQAHSPKLSELGNVHQHSPLGMGNSPRNERSKRDI